MAGHGYKQPKWYSSPTGGWHYTPANWRANSLIGLGILIGSTLVMYKIGEDGVFDEKKEFSEETIARWNNAAKKFNEK